MSCLESPSFFVSSLFLFLNLLLVGFDSVGFSCMIRRGCSHSTSAGGDRGLTNGLRHGINFQKKKQEEKKKTQKKKEEEEEICFSDFSLVSSRVVLH